jgi:surfeit locus 1 family protein
VTVADSRRPRLLSAVFVLVGFCILIGLGVWQVQRLKWKTALLHRIDALQNAPAEPAEAVLRRIGDGLDVGYVRVEMACPDLERTPTLRLFGVVEGQPGYRYVTACPLAGAPYRSILVDRGFESIDQAKAPLPSGEALASPIVGVLRQPDPKSFVAPANRPEQNLWYWRDMPAMAKALGADAPAPVMLMLESPAPEGGWPKPAPIPVNIPNNHLGYAITWFGLAAALAGVYLASLLRRRKS